MTKDYDDAAFVISSRYRMEVLNQLNESPRVPSDIAEGSEFAITHVSRSLSEMRGRDLVELLVDEETTKGRVYGITSKGERTLEKCEEINL